MGMEDERTRTVTFQIEDLKDDPLLLRLVTGNDYLSRFYGHIPAGTPDPTFAAAADVPDVARLIDLDEHVDPLLFWGCSSRTYPDLPPETTLPPQRFHLAELQLDLRVPDGWMMNTFTIPVTDEEPWAVVDSMQQLYVLAPQPAGAGEVAAFFAGESPTFPMLLIMPTEGFVSPEYLDFWIDAYLTAAFGGDITQPVTPPSARLRYMASDRHARGPIEGVYIAVLTSDADWAAHEALYTAMLNYADSYQFYLHPEFQHTLFLNGPWFDYREPEFFTHIPYPTDWIEHTIANGDIEITSASSPVMIRLVLMNPYLLGHEQQSTLAPEHWQAVVDFAETTYGLPDDQDWAALLAETLVCDTLMPAVEFQRDARRGYIRFTHRYLVEVSVPQDKFAVHQPMMNTLIEAVYSRRSDCEQE